MYIKVLLVEDEEHLAQSIQLNLELEGYTVTQVSDGKLALNVALSKKFDVIVLDVMLPSMDGFSICEQIRANHIDTPVLFLTAKGNSTDKIKGLKVGADDYLTKPFELEEFLLRVKNLLKRTGAGIAQNDLSSYSFDGNTIHFNSYGVQTHDGQTLSLSKREMELLKILIAKKNEVVSRDEILDKLWKDDALPTPRTIDNFILTYRKLFEHNSREPKHFYSIRGVGYKFVD